jgi:hypothetical protein
MPGNFQVRSQGMKRLLGVLNIMLEENLSNKYKNGHENFTGERVFMVLGLVVWIC